MRPISRSPARLSSAVSCLVAGVAVLASGLYSWPALSAGTLGMGLLLVGVVGGFRTAVSVGSGALFVGALIAGVQGAPVAAVLLSVTATVLAWEVGNAAISIGRQLGPTATTLRLELLHIAASAGVGTLTLGAGYLVYRNATGGQPLSALVLLIVATVLLLTAVLPDREDAGGV